MKMKKLVCIGTAVLMTASMSMSVFAAPAPAGQEVSVTFSTGETATATVGEPFEFFFQCDAPGDMGEPADGEEGAGITASVGVVTYSNVGLGGPYSYPTSELVTITDFDGDIYVTVCEAATNMDATHTIYFTEEEIESAIAYAEEMAAQMAANPMGGGDSESASAEGDSEAAPAEGDSEVAPAEGDSEAAPAEGDSEAAPAEGESAGEEADAESGSESGESEAEEPEVGQVITENLVYEDGVTLEEGNLYIGEEGYCVIMTVNGEVVGQAPGTYEGHVEFTVMPKAKSKDATTDYATKSIILKQDGLNYVNANTIGEIDENGISNADITADGPNLSVVTVVNDTYTISDSNFHILQTGNHESGGNDFTGDGCAISVTGSSVVTIDNVDVVGDGVTRTSLFGGLATHDSYPTVYVSDSNFTATGDIEGEDCAVWVLGLHGVVRTCQFDDYYDIYYNNTTLKSFGWACLSVDGTEYPYEEDLTELNAAYVDGEGYVNEDGSEMSVADFAILATGLTDEYIAQLAAVGSADDLKALPQTNDYSLYYFAGKNTLTNCELDIIDMEEGRTGYSSYSIGANINVYSNCLINADYGNVEANEYASSAYLNGTVVNARKSIVMCHSNAGGITMCADSELNAGEIAFIYKGTGDGYVQDELNAEGGSEGGMVMGATGSNLYIRNCKINAPAVVVAFDSDDPGSLGGTQIDFDDSIAAKDENFDVTNPDNWHAASVMWGEGAGAYNYNEAVQVYIEDCTGETAINSNIFNCHQFTSKNLVLTLDNTEITGIISSGYAEHKVDGVMKDIPYGADNVTTEDGLVYGCRENMGDIVCTPAETVNNGVILSLENGSVWNVTETSYVSVLNVDETSVVNGVITELENGMIQIDPAA